MKRMVAVASPIIFAGIVFALSQPDAEGCASVRRSNRPEDYIRIAEESALIVWDAKNKTEHFVRRAAFDTKAPDFGFLVPTPTLPVLAEAKDLLFREAAEWIVPKTVNRSQWSFAPLGCMIGCSARPASRMDAAKSGIRILAEQNVGGFDAKVLQADDADDLAKWLKDNGYSADPELYAWLTPYVSAKWKITAFKISQDPHTGQLATTRPVRMSFATDRPFFPYREPEVKEDKQNRRSRLLRVFFISDARVQGEFGNKMPWHARVPWSDELSEEQRADVAKDSGIAAADLPAKLWMTAFEDSASPRPGKEEVYFEPSADRSPIRPPPLIRYNEVWMPLDVVFFGVMFLFLFGWSIKRVGWKGIMPSGRTPRPETPNGPPYTPWTSS